MTSKSFDGMEEISNGSFGDLMTPRCYCGGKIKKLSRQVCKSSSYFGLFKYMGQYTVIYEITWTDESAEKKFSMFSLTNLIVFVNIKNNKMWCLQHTQKKLGQRQNETEKGTSNTVLEGSTISNLTGNRSGASFITIAYAQKRAWNVCTPLSKHKLGFIKKM